MDSHNQKHQLARYLQWVSAPTKTSHIQGAQCLPRHAGAHDFDENLMAPKGSFKTSHLSYISSGCHNSVGNPPEVGHLKMWRPGQ
jgi:hypothetical protein